MFGPCDGFGSAVLAVASVLRTTVYNLSDTICTRHLASVFA